MKKSLTELIKELENSPNKGIRDLTASKRLNEVLNAIRRILLQQKTDQEKMRQEIDVISRNISALFRNQDKLIKRK